MDYQIVIKWYLYALLTFLVYFVPTKCGFLFNPDGGLSKIALFINLILIAIIFTVFSLFASHELMAKKGQKGDKIAEELIDKRDKPKELIKTVKKIGEIVDSNKEFDTAIAYKDGKPAIGIRPKPGTPVKIDLGTKFDKKEREEEFKKFWLGENSHFEFTEEELKKFEIVIGKTVVESAEKGKLILDEVFPELPPMKLRTKSPDGNYSCFDYMQFKIRQIKDGFIYLDNREQDRTVIVDFIFHPKRRELKFAIDFVKINRKSKTYNINHEIDFYEFQKNLLRNGRLLFINLNDNSTFAETGHFIPVNIDSGVSFRNMEAAITLFQAIRKIEDKFNLKFKIPERITSQDVRTIEDVVAAIDDKEVRKYFETFEFETSYEQAINSLTHPEFTDGFEMLLDTMPLELFGETIQLGKFQATFPACKPLTTIEQLEVIKDKTKPVFIQLKALESNAQFRGYFLDFRNNKSEKGVRVN